MINGELDKGDDLKSDVTPLAEDLLESLKLQPEQVTDEMVNKWAEQVISGWAKDQKLSQSALTGQILLSIYGDRLNPEVQMKINFLVSQARIGDKLVDKTIDRVQIMSSQVQDYFTHPYASRDYFRVSALPSDLANTVVALECHLLSSRLNQQFKQNEQDSYRADPFVDSKTGEAGVWMSTDGTPLPIDMTRADSSY
jgi:hypothetical protein